MAKSTEDLIPLLRNAQNVVIYARDYSTMDIINLLRHMGEQTHMTIRGASVKTSDDLVRISQNSKPGTITFDFT